MLLRIRSSFGLTVIEIFVVIAVIGVVSTLVIAGVVHVRRSATKATCAARIRQIGTAMHSYEASHQSIVIAGARSDGWNISPHVRLLAFLEEDAIHALVNHQRCDYRSLLVGVDVNATAARRRIATYLCPGDSSVSSGTSFFYCVGRGPLQRGSVQSGKTAWVMNDDQGLFMSIRSRTRAQILKGNGQVAAFGERIQGDGTKSHLDRWRDIATDSAIFQSGYADGRPFADVCARQEHPTVEPLRHSSEAGRTWFLPEIGTTAYTHSLTPNSAVTDCGGVDYVVPWGAVSARSWHSGGVNVLFADGSVRFVSDSVAFDVWQSQASMALD